MFSLIGKSTVGKVRPDNGPVLPWRSGPDPSSNCFWRHVEANRNRNSGEARPLCHKPGSFQSVAVLPHHILWNIKWLVDFEGCIYATDASVSVPDCRATLRRQDPRPTWPAATVLDSPHGLDRMVQGSDMDGWLAALERTPTEAMEEALERTNKSKKRRRHNSRAPAVWSAWQCRLSCGQKRIGLK